jgi:hypothetical protein
MSATLGKTVHHVQVVGRNDRGYDSDITLVLVGSDLGKIARQARRIGRNKHGLKQPRVRSTHNIGTIDN